MDAAYSDARVDLRAGASPVPSRETELNAALGELSNLGKQISEARASLVGTAERLLVGDVPTTTAAGGLVEDPRARRDFNHGLTGQLRRMIEETADVAADVLRYAERLRQVG